MKHSKDINAGFVILPLLFAFLLCSCKTQDKAKDLDLLSAEIENLIQEYHVGGKFDGTVLVADADGLVFKGAFGKADRQKGIPLTTQSQFYLASVSKQFTANAIVLLIKNGDIQVDDLIVDYLPELPSIYNAISFRNLLNHTSGIPDYYNFADLYEGFTNTDVLNVLKGIDRLEFEPGTRYQYSNSGYVLLSILVERVSDKTFAQFLNTNALEKAGLTSTIVFDEFAPVPENRAVGYGRDSTLTDYRFRTTGGGGIYSNVEDLYRWHLALSEGILLDEKTMEMAYSPTVLKNDSTVYYGFGWFLDPDDPGHVGHDGNLEGFRTVIDRQLDTGRVIIVLSNNSSEYIQEIVAEIRELWSSQN